MCFLPSQPNQGPGDPWFGSPEGVRFGSPAQRIDQATTAEQAQIVEAEARRADAEARRAEEAERRAEDEARRAGQEARRAEEEARRANRMAAKLRAAGIDPDAE